MSSRSTTVKLINNTPATLKLTNAKLSHGVWSQNMYPPETINGNSDGIWMSESDGFMTGTEGTVTYALPNGAGNVVIHWDNPYVGSNSYSDSVPSGYQISRSGGGGDNATVTFTLEVSKNIKSTSFRSKSTSAMEN